SIGIRGGYSRESYETNLAKLRSWLKNQKDWKEAGEPYAVYWNGPFTLPFFKRSEVHLPVVNDE
ncbi:MAG: ABC transporter substrate-binding protein, partial [Verrucomicrobia bacterium]|nr:ABC transporter substrate-binding protein [Verrucomicrobiota bacterium]